MQIRVREKMDRITGSLREWRWLSRYIRRYRWSVTAFVGLGMLSVLMGLAVSLATRDLMNAVSAPQKVAGDMIAAVAWVAGLSVGQIVFNAVSMRLTAHVNSRVINDIRREVFEKIVCARWEDLRVYHSGELLNRLEGDVGNVAGGVIRFIPRVITGGVKLVGAFAILFFYDPVMALLALTGAPLLVLVSRPMMRRMKKFNRETRRINGEILAFNEEAFRNIRLIKAFDLAGNRSRALEDLLERYRREQLAYARVSVRIRSALAVLGLAAGYACYAWGAYRLYHGAIDLGTMVLFVQLSGALSGAFSSLVSLVPAAVSTVTSCGRIMELTSLIPETDADAPTALRMLALAAPSGGGEGICVRAEDMCFSYGDGEALLDHVNFQAFPGEVVAFVGASGAGKTTLLQLLLGLLSPTAGRLTVTGAIGEVGETETLCVSDSTRRLCAYVPQGNGVFSGTVEDNLRSAVPEATPAEMEEALRAADLWSFICAQPEGIHTELGEHGNNFSEGQVQRLALARAFLRRAPILILDEATSALDPATETRVLENIMRGEPRRVCLITTHRESMLKYADRVYALEGGRLVERGRGCVGYRGFVGFV